jgi:elongation factor P hydroxylase
LIPFAPADDRPEMGAIFATGIALASICAWSWWRMTGTFMQFLRDFRKWAREAEKKEEAKREQDEEEDEK